jgi:dTDP-4-amino-4,6-dideoxygalactose transaminase
MAALASKDIATGIHYPVPLHLTGAYRHLGYPAGSFPVAERIAGELVSLPMYPELTGHQIEFVCHALRRYCRSAWQTSAPDGLPDRAGEPVQLRI